MLLSLFKNIRVGTESSLGGNPGGWQGAGTIMRRCNTLHLLPPAGYNLIQHLPPPSWLPGPRKILGHKMPKLPSDHYADDKFVLLQQKFRTSVSSLMVVLLHCKDTIPKIRNKDSQKRNCADSVRIFHIIVSVSDLFIPTIDLPILLQENM